MASGSADGGDARTLWTGGGTAVDFLSFRQPETAWAAFSLSLRLLQYPEVDELQTHPPSQQNQSKIHQDMKLLAL